MTTLINIAKKIGTDNRSTLRVILSNYETDKLINGLPRHIVNNDNNYAYHFELKSMADAGWAIRYARGDKDVLLSLSGFDLRQLLINMLIDIIYFRLTHSNYKCNNEF